MSREDTVGYRRAEPHDAEAIAGFAASVFVEAYREQSPVDALEAYAREHFSVAQIRSEIASPHAVFLIAEAAGRIVGYALSWLESQPECELAARRPAQLQRIYVAPAWQGRGVAQELVGRSLSDASHAGCDVVWLAVWEANPRAIRFYQKTGFQVVGEQPFVLGGEVQRDFVMVWPYVRRSPQNC